MTQCIDQNCKWEHDVNLTACEPHEATLVSLDGEEGIVPGKWSDAWPLMRFILDSGDASAIRKHRIFEEMERMAIAADLWAVGVTEARAASYPKLLPEEGYLDRRETDHQEGLPHA